AYFSSARRPGVVLRVQATRVDRPCSRATTSRVAVGMPLSRPRTLSAVRSPVSSARARALTRATVSPAFASLPSGLQISARLPGAGGGDGGAGRGEGGGESGGAARLPGHDGRAPLELGGHDRVGREVAGAA